MSEYRASRGVPMLTGWQWLIAAAAVGAGWFIWVEVRTSQEGSGVTRDEDAEPDPVAAAFDNLRTVEAIARTGPGGVLDLVDALANPNFRLRRNALFALRQMGPEAAEALASIRERIADEEAQVRSFAIDAYWHIRRDPDDVAAVVVPLLGDPDANVRIAAANVLERIGPSTIGPVVELLRNGAPAARVPALTILRRIGWDRSQPQIDDVVRDLMHDPDAHVEALLTLAAWGYPAPPEISELLRHADEADGMWRDARTAPGPRETALRAIILQGPAAAENLNDVLDLLAEDRLGGQQWSLALAALRTMQSAARPAVPRLLQFANQNHDHRRIDLCWTLQAIGVDPQEIVRITAPLLLDKDTETCFHAGRLCASVSSEEARRQVSRLIPQLAPEKIADGMSALDAVWGMAAEAQEAIPALSRLLECDRPHVPWIAAKALGDIGPEAAPAIPVLLAQLARGRDIHDHSTRSALCEALGKMGPIARSAIPALLAELNSAPLSRPNVFDLDQRGQRPIRESMSALVRIGNAGPAVLAAIRRHFANEDEHVQISALQALAQLTPDSAELLACHLNWLRNDRGLQNRIGVILTIGRLSGDRQDAVTLLSALLADASPEIRKAAAWSLGKMGPDAAAAIPALKRVLNDWKDSLYSFHNRRLPSLPDDPRVRLDKRRWLGLDEPVASLTQELPFAEKCVHHVVREAIAMIEAGLAGNH